MPLRPAGRGQGEPDAIPGRCRQGDHQIPHVLAGELPHVAEPVLLARGQLSAARQPPKLHVAQGIERTGRRRGEGHPEAPGAGAVRRRDEPQIERSGGGVAGASTGLDVVARPIADQAIPDGDGHPDVRRPGELRRPRRQAAVLDVDGPQVVWILRRDQRRGHRDDRHGRQHGQRQHRDSTLRILGRDPAQRRPRVAGRSGGRDGRGGRARHRQSPPLRAVRIRGSITEYRMSTIRLMVMNSMTITIR